MRLVPLLALCLASPALAGEALDQALLGKSYAIVHGADDESVLRVNVIESGTGTMPLASPPPVALPKLSPVAGATENAEAVARRRAEARDKVLKRMQATAEAVRKRLAELPPGNHIIRTQAVRLTPGDTPGQTGNIPLLSSAYDLDRRPKLPPTD